VYENAYRQENKDAVVWARRLLQYCQLYKKFRDISRLISNFFCLISTLPCFPRFFSEPWPGNTGLGCGLDDTGFQSRQWQVVFLFKKAARRAMGPTQPPVQWILGIFPGVKRPGRQVDHSSSAEVANECSCTSAPSWRGLEQMYFLSP